MAIIRTNLVQAFSSGSQTQQSTLSEEKRSSLFGSGILSKKQTITEQWVSNASDLSAGGVPFVGYLVYFGTGPRRQQYEQHRSLIDPTLDVSNGRDPHAPSFSDWPNYSELRPEARRSYLEWLSAGRKIRHSNWLRVHILLWPRTPVAEGSFRSRFRGNHGRNCVWLLAIYGDNHSFKNYCCTLLDMGELLFGNVEETPEPTLENRYSWELPILTDAVHILWQESFRRRSTRFK